MLLGFNKKTTLPSDIPSIQLWLDSADATTVTLAYQTATETVSGTISTTVLTASATMARIARAGMTIRVDSADVYTVASIEGTTINTVETLTATYAALTSLEVAKSPSQVDDKSGNSRDITQGTSSLQPIRGINTLGSKYGLDFDGTDDRMDGDATFLANTEYTVFVVAKANSNASGQWIMGGTTAAVNQNFHCGYRSATQVTLGHYGSDLDATVASGYSLEDRVLTFQLNSSGRLIRGDGVELVTDAVSTQLSTNTGFKVGRLLAITPFDGSVYEIIMYDRALSLTEMQTVENYLINKWKYNALDIINNNFVMYLNAKDTDTIEDTSGAVDKWNDQTDFAVHVDQTTSSERPTTNASTQNGYNVIDFDITNNEGLDYTISMPNLTGSEDRTVIMVINQNTGPTNDSQVFGSNGSNYIDTGVATGVDRVRLRQGATSLYTPLTSFPYGSYGLAVIEGTSASTKVWINGTNQLDSVTVAFSYGLGAFYVGNPSLTTRTFGGSMAILGVIDGTLLDYERQILEEYFNQQWAVY